MIHHALLAVASFLSIAGSPADPEPIIVPTLICRGYFLVPVTLAPRADSGEQTTLWFLHDTGASSTYIDPESFAQASGLHLGMRDRAMITGATSGRLQINSLQARIGQMDHLSRALGHRIDGILSFGSLSDFLLTLDYAHGEMRLEQGQLPPPDGVTVFDASGPDYRPWIVVNFPDRNRRMLIDSGAALTSLAVRGLDLYETVEPPRRTGATMRLREVELRSGARSALDARIGPNVLVAPTLQSTPGTELVGGEVMRHFTWTFDQSTERVRMVRNDPQTPITFAPDYDHGMVLEPVDQGYRVRSIIADTPASQADIRIGDIVTAFNDRPLDDRDCAGPSDNTLVLGLIRDGRAIRVTLELYPLVE